MPKFTTKTTEEAPIEVYLVEHESGELAIWLRSGSANRQVAWFTTKGTLQLSYIGGDMATKLGIPLEGDFIKVEHR